jgi:hypothetical protein
MIFKKKYLLLSAFVVVSLFTAGFAYYKLKVRSSEISGFFQNPELKEISGIAASQIFEDTYYVHNDSGDTSRFFAVDPQGKLISTFYFPEDQQKQHTLLDCEDISVGKGPEAGKSFVYLADIGDNANVRPYVTIYRFEEKPSWLQDSVHHVIPAQLHLTYPDGPKDAEAMMVDPIQHLMYIVNKRTDTIRVYTTPLNFKNNEDRVLTLRSKIHIKGFKPFKYITAGDISKDGSKILLKSYGKVYYWQRQQDEPVWETMQRKPTELPYDLQRQGEAIGFTANGEGYYTTSESSFAAIYYYTLP